MANDQHPLLGALGLCRKAGKLLHGYDRVQEKAPCEGVVPCRRMPLTTADLAVLTPKPAAVFGITDEHLAQLCAKHLA